MSLNSSCKSENVKSRQKKSFHFTLVRAKVGMRQFNEKAFYLMCWKFEVQKGMSSDFTKKN